MIARTIPALLLAATLAACARTPRPVAEDPPPSPLVAECREEARASRDILAQQARQSNVDNLTNVLRLREERADAEDIAFRDCLRRRGAPLPGGVERVRR